VAPSSARTRLLRSSAVVDEIQRPTTSTRDAGELRRRLEAWLATRLPEGAEPSVSTLEIPSSNGMSSETVLFEAAWRENGDRRSEALVARMAPDPAAVPVFPTYDLIRQARTIALVAEKSSVPVPRIYWSEDDKAPLGVQFFVMERIEGEVPPDILPYNFGGSWLSDATPEQQRRLQDATVRLLAELHSIDDPGSTFEFLDTGTGATALARHVAEQWSFYEWVTANGPRSPLLEQSYAWLKDHWPSDERAAVLSWGDSRIGNVMYRDFEPVAVLDWEMAALAPPEVDVGWMIFLHRFFEDLAAGYELPGMPDFMQRDDVATTYESATGSAPRDLDFYTAYAAFRHGIIMSRVNRRSIHFGEAEMPADVDDLIPHRASLEAMLAGTYWR